MIELQFLMPIQIASFHTCIVLDNSYKHET